MATVIFCSVCGFPIVKGVCVHTVMGLTAKEWRERVANEKAKKAPQK